MDINNITAVYFVGAGGIGMSALIRYFLSKGKKVGGYDKTPSGLTEQLNYEGAAIHYEDNVDLIPDDFTDPAKTLVVYTPAVPEDHSELCYFRGNGFEVMQPRIVCGRYARQDNDLFDGRPPAETVSCGLQCFLRRYPEEL